VAPEMKIVVSEPTGNNAETIKLETVGNHWKTRLNNRETTPKSDPETKKQSPIGEAELFPPLARITPQPAHAAAALRPWGLRSLGNRYQPERPDHDQR
jgi:hypothetical protein